jgi:hypothetical protein
MPAPPPFGDTATTTPIVGSAAYATRIETQKM